MIAACQSGEAAPEHPEFSIVALHSQASIHELLQINARNEEQQCAVMCRAFRLNSDIACCAQNAFRLHTLLDVPARDAVSPFNWRKIWKCLL